MMFEGILCAKSHEYIVEDNGVYVVGLTEYAVEQLGDVVFVELPEIDSEFSKGEVFAKRKYTRMYVISEGRILVCVDKKYGVVDLQENILVPIKYKTFEKLGENLYLTKLNGYYGILDSKGKIVLKNEYDSIKPLYDTFVLKKCGKYGLADINGKLIFLPYCDKIKKLGEYILVKNNGLYSVCSSTGEVLNDKEYKKIRLERNTLEGKLKGDKYQPIETDI